jgi:2-keto-3-deoxy-L-fuconate dehydrogenase
VHAGLPSGRKPGRVQIVAFAALAPAAAPDPPGGLTMGQLAGLRALVTGGASGIGRAIADLFTEQEAAVVVLDTAARPGNLPGAVGYVQADITDDTAVRAAVQAAAGQLGGLDVLVNNAGIGAQGTVADSSDAEWLHVLDVNVVGTARVSRAAWPYLRESSHPAVVNTASVAATLGLPARAVYSASKGAVCALTRAMATDGLAEGIRVNAVDPGTADTPWVARLLDSAPDPAAERAALAARQPHGRLVTAQEVAQAVLYLASPAAGSTTGIELAVDGGMGSLQPRPAERPDVTQSRRHQPGSPGGGTR